MSTPYQTQAQAQPPIQTGSGQVDNVINKIVAFTTQEPIAAIIIAAVAGAALFGKRRGGLF